MNILYLLIGIFFLSPTVFYAEESEKKEPTRRALPAPFDSPPFPSGEFLGTPLIGIPISDTIYPLMKVIYKLPCGERIKKSRVKAYGWINGSGNISSCSHSNAPEGYWIVPNRVELDQFVFRLEREVDTLQTDHIDIGFRSTILYGIDYRYTTAGGWTSRQLLKHNYLYGYDFTEQYIDTYIPKIAQGAIIRIGRWASCPDIETQFVPDNYLGTHSLMFTFDTSTQTGAMLTVMLNKYWTVQAALHAGTDMAPWYKGAVPTGMLGIRWVSCDNLDSVYLMLNSINSAKFRRFRMYGQRLGHDNYNYVVATWQHKFSDDIHTKTEGYFMWQRNAVRGGTPSAGPVRSFGGGGGIGPNIHGTSLTYGFVNYALFKFSEKGFVTLRNEIWRDAQGERTNYPGTYTGHTIGFTYNFTEELQIRPEIGYYRNWNRDAFDRGKRKGTVLAGLDMTIRF
ncbi:outer membrane beta-barrel protein [Parachlamydia acanthamoebae]|jgi:hypothetical protein|uniref:outer membrane beta-barrel protein n=1 Tax=Parachlamydia acanthamoebae TaxID=83552 RepID=UPI0024E1B045|nr:outer membrane beta-barrel protein [Parachlamydia acanthamoebae]